VKFQPQRIPDSRKCLPGQEKSVRNPDGTRRKEVLIPDIADFSSRWNSAVDALEDAIKILRHPQEYGAVTSSFLPYVSILPVFAALRSHAKEFLLLVNSMPDASCDTGIGPLFSQIAILVRLNQLAPAIS